MSGYRLKGFFIKKLSLQIFLNLFLLLRPPRHLPVRMLLIQKTLDVYAAPVKNNLSFDFQTIDIRTLLQLIAKHAGLNFVISDAVKGNITLNLKNVSWQEALNIVLQSHGLANARKVTSFLLVPWKS